MESMPSTAKGLICLWQMRERISRLQSVNPYYDSEKHKHVKNNQQNRRHFRRDEFESEQADKRKSGIYNRWQNHHVGKDFLFGAVVIGIDVAVLANDFVSGIVYHKRNREKNQIGEFKRKDQSTYHKRSFEDCKGNGNDAGID